MPPALGAKCLWPVRCFTKNNGGYGSLLSQGRLVESLRDLSNVVAKIEAPNHAHEKARGWIDPSRRAKIPVVVLMP